MSTYIELIKNFERTRAYMREFYVYGFKSRDGYDKKSARSYDDERRRMESWLADHMRFVRTPDGKNVFISIDSRTSEHNPFYKAWKSKSFTDGDITLHFILFDLLHDSSVALSINEILERADANYLSYFEEAPVFDESTVRKKLREYADEGLVVTEKQGRRLLYRRAPDVILPAAHDWLDFYTEIAPCGVIGSFIHDKREAHPEVLTFKHHYMTGAMDSGVMAELFFAMAEKREVVVENLSRQADEPRLNRIVPLRIYISVQNGRQHLLAYQPDFRCIKSFRLDYLSSVKPREVSPRFDELRAELDRMEPHMWGVSTRRGRWGENRWEHVEFTVRVEAGEEYILRRMERERRVGRVEQVDDTHYRFVADVYDTREVVPWIRTFLGRITQLNFSNRSIENAFKADVAALYSLYGIEEEES